MIDMSPEEKWRRLTNPQCIADYEIGMTMDEIAQVPEAQAMIASYLPCDRAVDEFARDMAKRMGRNVAEYMEREEMKAFDSMPGVRSHTD